MKRSLFSMMMCLICIILCACGIDDTTGVPSMSPSKPMEIASEGLVYEMNRDGTYTVVGLGSCTARKCRIPNT